MSPHVWLLKDSEAGAVVLRGNVKDGLYCFNNKAWLLHNMKKVLNAASFSSKSVSRCTSSRLPYPRSSSFLAVNNSSKIDYAYIWHKMLGHPSLAMTNYVMKQCNAGPSIINKSFFCSLCALGKNIIQSFPHSTTQYSTPLQLISIDLWGPSPPLSSKGFQYYMSFIDHFKRYTWIILLKTKSEACKAFITFQKLRSNLTDPSKWF